MVLNETHIKRAKKVTKLCQEVYRSEISTII